MNEILSCYQAVSNRVTPFIHPEVASLSQGLALTLKSAGRLSWIILAAQPSNRTANFIANATRFAALLQAVTAAFAHLMARNDCRYADTAEKKRAAHQILAKLEAAQVIPFKGLFVCGKYLIERSLAKPVHVQQKRKEQILALKAQYNKASEGKQVQLCLSECQARIAREYFKEASPYSIRELAPQQKEWTTSIYSPILENLWISDYPVGQTESQPMDQIVVSPDKIFHFGHNQPKLNSTSHTNLADELHDRQGRFENEKPTYKSMATDLLQAARAVLPDLKSGKKLLLHCQVGANRSVSVAALAVYLAYKDDGTCNLTIEEALYIVMKGRDAAEPAQCYLWILSRMPQFIKDANNLDDYLLTPGATAYGQPNLLDVSCSGHTLLTQELVNYITSNLKQEFLDLKEEEEKKAESLRKIKEYCSPQLGGGLAITFFTNDKEFILDYLGWAETDPYEPPSEIWAALGMNKKNFSALEETWGQTSQATKMKNSIKLLDPSPDNISINMEKVKLTDEVCVHDANDYSCESII